MLTSLNIEMFLTIFFYIVSISRSRPTSVPSLKFWNAFLHTKRKKRKRVSLEVYHFFKLLTIGKDVSHVMKWAFTLIAWRWLRFIPGQVYQGKYIKRFLKVCDTKKSFFIFPPTWLILENRVTIISQWCGLLGIIIMEN